MSTHHRKQQWTTHAPKLRKKIAATLPAPCVECRGVVLPDMAWQVGHRVAASQGGRPTSANTGPVHTSCNLRAGGKLGAKVVNARKNRTRQVAKDIRAW